MTLELWQIIVALCALVGAGAGAFAVMKVGIATAIVRAEFAHKRADDAHHLIVNHITNHKGA